MKKVIRLTESQLKSVIKKIIEEQGQYKPIPGNIYYTGNQKTPPPAQTQSNPADLGKPVVNIPKQQDTNLAPFDKSKMQKAPNGPQNNTAAQDIIYVQRGLLRQNFGTGYMIPDGIFGKKTLDTVIAFQKAKGLPATGVVDQATANALGILPIVKTLPIKRNHFPKPVTPPSPQVKSYDQGNAENDQATQRGWTPNP